MTVVRLVYLFLFSVLFSLRGCGARDELCVPGHRLRRPHGAGPQTPDGRQVSLSHSFSYSTVERNLQVTLSGFSNMNCTGLRSIEV